jgi:hypothetical protein
MILVNPYNGVITLTTSFTINTQCLKYKVWEECAAAYKKFLLEPCTEHTSNTDILANVYIEGKDTYSYRHRYLCYACMKELE